MRPFLLACLLGLLPALAAAQPPAQGIAFFETKVRPVLVKHCYSCHSDKAKKLRAGLLLDTRGGILQGGDSGPAVVPGKPAESLLIKALRHEGPQMPSRKEKLSDPIIADFVQWVKLGAPLPADTKPAIVQKGPDIEAGRNFRSFRPLRVSPPSQVKNEGWARTPIDRFILARLEEKKLTPSAPLAREKLLRRAYFDLLGLPPTRAEIDAFLKDTAPDAYERLIDQLLRSERHGERWARHWLDVARFAESGGYEFDGDRPGAFHYRDFVIRAFNDDMPYDQFVRWQIAGDLLFPGEYLPTAATGFLVAGPYPGQVTAKTLAQIRYDHLDDMVSTIGSSMLGLTVACARCHDHKYDPVPQKDYYSLIAALGRTDSRQVKLDPKPNVYREAKAKFDKAHEPFLRARERFEKDDLPGRIAKLAEAQKAKKAAPWLALDLVSSTRKGGAFTRLEDGSVLASGPAARADTYTFTAHTHHKGITALRVEALADKSLPRSGPGRGPDGSFALANAQISVTPLQGAGKGKSAPVKVRAGKTAWSVGPGTGKDQSFVLEFDRPIGFDGGTLLTVTLTFPTGPAIGRPRLAITTLPGMREGPTVLQHESEILALLDSEKGRLTDRNRSAVGRWYRSLDAQARKIYEAEEQHARLAPQQPLVNVFAAGPAGGPVHFLVRGEPARKGALAEPGFLQVLSSAAAVSKKAAVDPRVALADRLTDTKDGAGHLLARVIVNRLWQHHMGRGLVGTPNDFGAQGEAPTHPELLDWLAAEPIRGGWKLKPIHKLIMSSAVYRQGPGSDLVALKIDPHNHLWWQRRPQRLEAEALRDALLAVSGALNTTMYGPGTLDENSPRRSVYLTIKRSGMLPMLAIFDAPEAAQSTGERQLTTVPTQALALLNSPFVLRRAGQLAKRVRPTTPGGLGQAVEDAYLLALTRRPAADERARMVAFLERHSGKALDAALTDFCQVLLCLNEFAYVDLPVGQAFQPDSFGVSGWKA